MPEINGDVAVMPLADLVVWFGNREASGLLRLEQGGLTKEFALERGMAIRASSNDPREYLGQFLVHFGLLTEDQLQRALATQRETKVLLGRILVMIGIVPEDQLVQALRSKIRESLLDTFQWRRGRFTFASAIPSTEPRPEIPVSVPLLDLHREGMNRATMWEQFEQIFLTKQTILTVHDSKLPFSATPDTLDGRIVSLARHGHTIEAITFELRATAYQVSARIFEMYRAGAIEPRALQDLPPVQALVAGAGVNGLHSAQPIEQTPTTRNDVRQFDVPSLADPPREPNFGGPTLVSDFPPREAVPVLARPVESPEARPLSAKQRYVLARIDGQRTVQSILGVSPMKDAETLEIMRQFLRIGVVRI